MFTQMLLMAAAMLVAGSLEGLEAQERPDFSGTWVVERVESEGPQGNVDGGRQGGGQGRGGIRGQGGGRGRGGGGIRGGAAAEDGARVVAPVEVFRVQEEAPVRRINRATA